MRKITMIILAAKWLRLISGSLRFTMGGMGAALTAWLLWERIKKRKP